MAVPRANLMAETIRPPPAGAPRPDDERDPVTFMVIAAELGTVICVFDGVCDVGSDGSAPQPVLRKQHPASRSQAKRVTARWRSVWSSRELGKTLAPKSAHFGGVRAPALQAPPNGPGFDNGILRKANDSGAFRILGVRDTAKF